MATCGECGNTYFTRECLECKSGKHQIREKNQRSNGFFRKNIALAVIAVAVSIIALIMMRNEYVKHQEQKQIAKLLYGTDDYDEIEKINKKIMKQNEKSIEQFRKLFIPQ
jgi:hypothetical protein